MKRDATELKMPAVVLSIISVNAPLLYTLKLKELIFQHKRCLLYMTPHLQVWVCNKQANHVAQRQRTFKNASTS